MEAQFDGKFQKLKNIKLNSYFTRPLPTLICLLTSLCGQTSAVPILISLNWETPHTLSNQATSVWPELTRLSDQMLYLAHLTTTPPLHCKMFIPVQKHFVCAITTEQSSLLLLYLLHLSMLFYADFKCRRGVNDVKQWTRSEQNKRKKIISQYCWTNKLELASSFVSLSKIKK